MCRMSRVLSSVIVRQAFLVATVRRSLIRASQVHARIVGFVSRLRINMSACAMVCGVFIVYRFCYFNYLRVFRKQLFSVIIQGLV